MSSGSGVTAAAGSLRQRIRVDTVLPHAWTDEGVAVALQFTGAHVLHLAVAACVLNDLYREAARAGVELRGVLVGADGEYDRQTWQSTGISYRVEVDSDAGEDAVRELIALVDDVAEIPRALRQAIEVRRRDGPRLESA